MKESDLKIPSHPLPPDQDQRDLGGIRLFSISVICRFTLSVSSGLDARRTFFAPTVIPIYHVPN